MPFPDAAPAWAALSILALVAVSPTGDGDSRPASRPAESSASSAAAPPAASLRPPKDYAAHAAALRRRHRFPAIAEPPFVVTGDAAEATLRHWAAGTVRWAVDRLTQDFFDCEPAEIIDIWLFEGDASYRRNALQLFGDEPSTPFGYFSPRHQALVMNIATGGGTLVHEIVHPFLHVNFPRCPPWFNEGLASLFEQCGERDGHIVGFPNWRLAGLKKAIEAGEVPAFETLLSMDEEAFYGEGRAVHYAAARYLCYYLQEKGRLRSFYRSFVARASDDPTGLETLRDSLGTRDLEAFQEEWEAFVMGLTFP